MKKKILALALTFLLPIIGIVAQEQDQKNMKYLFSGNTDISITGFGGPMVGFSSIGDEFEVSVGGGGAILFNQKFFIGGYGIGTASSHERNLSIYVEEIGTNETYENLSTGLGHGGFWLGYIHNPHQPIHLGISTKIGFGSITLDQRNSQFNSDHNEKFESDNVFVLMPQLELEMNLLKWMKVNLAVGYRYVSGVNKQYPFMENGDTVYKDYFGKEDFNKVYGNVTIIFGWFSS
jgi:hypothetical protein